MKNPLIRVNEKEASPHLSLVIPTYNEEKNIEKTLSEIKNFLNAKDFPWEVIVSDDGSRDKTVKLAEDFSLKNPGFRILKNHHQGKGPTLIKGMSEAKGEIVLFSDADLATPIEEVDKLLSQFKDGFDVAIGSRGLKREGAPLLRLILAKGFNSLVQVIALPGISDTQCGFKSFKNEAIKKIIDKSKLYSTSEDDRFKTAAVTPAFDVEILLIAKRLKFKIAQVPVKWHHVGTIRVNPLRDSIAALLGIIRLRFNDLLGAYNQK